MKDNSITIAKGIGITLVVIAHIMEGYIGSAIFTFHMPFFFILSGMLYKPEEDISFIRKKTKRLLFPYLFYSAIFIILGIQDILTTDKNTYFLIKELLIKNLLGGPYIGGWQSVFWFISVLYLSLVIYNFISNKLRNITIFNLMLFMIISAYIYSLLPHPKFLLILMHAYLPSH